jgi:multimeric flavodoxin WrbA
VAEAGRGGDTCGIIGPEGPACYGSIGAITRILNGKQELIRLDPEGGQDVLLEDGLVSPTAVAIGDDGAIYSSNYGQNPGIGEVIRLDLGGWPAGASGRTVVRLGVRGEVPRCESFAARYLACAFTPQRLQSSKLACSSRSAVLRFNRARAGKVSSSLPQVASMVTSVSVKDSILHREQPIRYFGRLSSEDRLQMNVARVISGERRPVEKVKELRQADATEARTKGEAMTKAIAINGSPRMDRGNTAEILAPFVEGMREAGADVELYYASRLKVKPCTCGQMACWYDRPGECCIQDSMQTLYPSLRAANTLILATPVYIPLPGDMQNVINRLCPLIEPRLETRAGRTRARFREGVAIRRVALVAVGGWWEKENLDLVVRIVEELAENASVEFAGAVLRPHAYLMSDGGGLTRDGREVLEAARRAGRELVEEGAMRRGTLEAVSQPLISEEALRERYNRAIA